MADNFIPVANPGAQMFAFQGQILEAVKKVLSSQSYILGPEVDSFEREFADFLGIQFCIGLASGTDAISIALRAIGVSSGDEVITVSHSAVATAAAIEQIGAVPVFVDIEPESLCIDPEKIRSVLTKKTKAIIPVHIYGQPAQMHRIIEIAQQNNLKVIEDCAQAHGAEINGVKAGTLGEASAFSFYPTKNLGAIGDGGAVVTNCPEIAETVRSLRQYGWEKNRISSMPGYNSRLDEMQAAILRLKLPHLSEHNTRRREIAKQYCSAIDGKRIVPPSDIDNTLHAMHLFVVRCTQRDSLQDFFKQSDIGTAIHYLKPIHQQPAYIDRIKGADNLPCTENLYKQILTLPMYPELKDNQIERICSALIKWDSIK